MLLGKTSYVLGENFPYHYGSVTELKQYEERVADLRYINYIIFGYYVPYSLMFDRDYIYWRLTKSNFWNYLHLPSMAFGLSKEFFDMAFPKRLQTILETHSLKKKELQHLLRIIIIIWKKIFSNCAMSYRNRSPIMNLD